MNIVIWGKDNCRYCDNAKKLLESKEINYTYLSLGRDFDREQIIDKFPNAKTFPQIVIDDESIGGYAELLEIMENQNVW